MTNTTIFINVDAEDAVSERVVAPAATRVAGRAWCQHQCDEHAAVLPENAEVLLVRCRAFHWLCCGVQRDRIARQLSANTTNTSNNNNPSRKPLVEG